MHSGILFKLKSEWNSDICYNIDEPGRHYAKWNKPDIKRQILSNFYDSNFNVTELLNHSGYAEDYIRANFKKFVGKTPVEYLNELRINHAKTLINVYQNSVPLIDISLNCGFIDYIYFSRKFKQVVGISPIEYKKMILTKTNE